MVVTTGSYNNPSWITGLSWTKISSTPTTLAGYGITDAVPSSRTITINGVTQDLSANRTWTIAAGVSSIIAGTGISVNQTTGAVTVTNTGVLSVNGSTGAVTGVLTTSNYSSTLDSVYLKGTTDPSTPGNFTLSIGNNGSYSYVQSHSSQPLYLNPLGNAVFIGAGNTVLHSGNYNSYAPTLTGGGASGTWGISITGSSSSANELNGTSIANLNTDRPPGKLQYYDQPGGIGAPGGGWHSYISVRHNNSANQFGFQLANGFGSNDLLFRGWDGANPYSWIALLTTNNYNSYAPTLTGGGASGTWGISITGNADTVDGLHASAFALVNGNTANSFGVFELSYAATTFNPSAAPRSTMNPMSIKMWNNYFNGTGLGWDYGTVMQYYSLGAHVDTQVYFDASGGSWYRSASYNAGWQSWQKYVTENSGTWNISITGNAATATTASTANSVAWSNISSGYRTNFDLGFRPPDNSSSYAGFRFGTVGNDADAGYLLIRGGADDGVYTQDGITLVADKGWLTLAQRTTANRGVRIMTGTSPSTERARFLTDGQIQFLNGTGFTYNGNVILHSANFNSYSPTLTGGGASGTWNINVTGSSGSTRFVESPDGTRNPNTFALPTSNPRSVRYDFSGAGFITGATGNYAGVMTYAPWDGTSASTGDSSYQLAFCNWSGVNASGLPGLAIRNGINSSWNGTWYQFLHSGNFNSYALPLSGGTLTGPLTIGTTVNSTIWNDGTGTYIENTGNSSATRVIRLQAHDGSFNYTQLFINGSGGFVSVNNQMRAPIFYDSQDTTYFLDPNSESRLYQARFYDRIGIGGGVMPYINTGSAGIWFSSTTNNAQWFVGMSGGDFRIYHSVADRVYIDTAANMTAYGSMRAPIFYDSENTGYYLDPNAVAFSSVLSGTIRLDTGAFGTNSRSGSSQAAISRTFAPQGASNGFNGGGITAAIKIRLPFRANDCMWSMKVRIYNYANNQTSEYTIGNYSYSAGSWNRAAYFIGGVDAAPQIVRFGNDGSFDCVWIGETSTSWSYPQVSVMDFQGGYARSSVQETANNWDITFVTSFNTVADAITPSVRFSNVFAPIYYDSQDSSYYLDPNGGSNLRGMVQVLGNHSTAQIRLMLPAAENGASTGNVALQMWCSEPNATWDWAGFGYNVTNSGDTSVTPAIFTRINSSLGQAFMRMASTGDWYFLNTNTSGVRYQTMHLTSAGNAIFQGSVTATSFFESSDFRLKSEIKDLDIDVSSIIAKSYLKNGIEEIGYIAQDVQSILPSAISKRDDGYLDLSYRQVHTAKIAALEKRILYLEQQLKNKTNENN